ncbi:MAG: TolC family protein [Candidatus Omnitrophica bacterium]|nr:TolC family protein [Candidatus Omnitrophota bacterium]
MKKSIYLFILFSLCLCPRQAAAEETLTWQDCLAQARQNNPDLISAEESVKEQQAGKSITASALYPQVNASLDASTSKTSGSGSGGSTTKDSYSYGITGSQLIFDGFKTFDDVKAASENIKAARQNYRFASSVIRLNLRSAFVNLLKSQELIGVAEDIIRIRRDNLELITLRYYSGFEHKGALLTAEANLAQAEFELAQAKRNLGLYQRELAKEMGCTEFKPMSVKADFTVKDPVNSKPDFEALAKTHPSLLEAAAKKNAAAFSIRSAYAEFAPQLSGQASAGKSGEEWSPNGNQWSLGLGLTLPIFEGGKKIAQVSKAQAVYNQTVADERSAKDSIVVTLEQSWAALQDAIETVGVEYKSLIACEERSNIAQAQFSTGFITFDNWIIIENDLVSAKKSYLGAQANALLSEASWIKAKGETLEYAQ